jgi:hypothetical protein
MSQPPTTPPANQETGVPPELLQEIKEATEAAAPGPWVEDYLRVLFGAMPTSNVVSTVSGEPWGWTPTAGMIYDEGGHTKDDAIFIAGSRTWVPLLVSEIERLNEEIERLNRLISPPRR